MFKLFRISEIAWPCWLGAAWLIVSASVGWGGERVTINRIVTGPHDDEGLRDRYAVPYQPITYGQRIKAPLPGLAYSYKLRDWDSDGLVDIIANVRRGYGVVVYRNVGTKAEPLFTSLHDDDNQILMREPSLGRYFDLADFNGDGKLELIGYDGQNDIKKNGRQSVGLAVYYNQGDTLHPKWQKHYVEDPEGGLIRSVADVWNAPRVVATDWDGDGRLDLIIGYEHLDQILPRIERNQGANRLAGFRDPSRYNPDIGRVGWLRNVTPPNGPVTFERQRRLQADGVPIVSYHHPEPCVFDIDEDGDLDLFLGAKDARIRVFLNTGSQERPALSELGLLSDTTGTPIRTALAVRFEPADLNGDGHAELIGCAYFGNQDRYLVFQHDGGEPLKGWNNVGALSMQADLETPVYGMGNSTMDPVDWDDDGDTDLLLGAEPGVPTILINEGDDRQRRFAPARRLQFVDGAPVETFSIDTGVGSYWGPGEWYSDRLTPRAVDWDGDGTLDIVSGSMARRLYFFKGQRVAGELRFEQPRLFQRQGEAFDVPDRIQPGITDWDGDGKPDILISNHPGNLELHLGDGTLNLSDPIRFYHVDGSPVLIDDFWNRQKGNRSSFSVADWDGDGMRDLLVFMFHKGVYWFRNRGNRFEAGVALVEPLYSHNTGISVLDWDQDGKLDLLIGGDERRMIEPSQPGHLVVYSGATLSATEPRIATPSNKAVLHQKIRIPAPLLARDERGAFGGDLRVGDLDGDGRCDFLVYRCQDGAPSGAHQGGMKPSFLGAYDMDAKVLWQVGEGGNQPSRPMSVAVGDITGDAAAEVICFWHRPDPAKASDWTSLSDVVVQIRAGRTGDVLREAAPDSITRRRLQNPQGANWVHQRLLIANLRGTDQPQDIVVKLGDTIVALNDQLETLWTYQSPWAQYGECPAYIPAVGDLDGDGRDEVNGGFFVLDDNGKPLWENAISKHMDSVAIAAWDEGNLRAIGSGFGHVLSGAGEVILRLGEALVPHGQEVRVADFIKGSPGPEMIIRHQGHNPDVLIVRDALNPKWETIQLNPSPNNVGMTTVFWNGLKEPALLFNGGWLWELETASGAALPGLPPPNGMQRHRMGFHHAIAADLIGDDSEELVVWDPTAADIFIYASSSGLTSLYDGYKPSPRQYNPRLMD